MKLKHLLEAIVDHRVSPEAEVVVMADGQPHTEFNIRALAPGSEITILAGDSDLCEANKDLTEENQGLHESLEKAERIAKMLDARSGEPMFDFLNFLKERSSI